MLTKNGVDTCIILRYTKTVSGHRLHPITATAGHCNVTAVAVIFIPK